MSAWPHDDTAALIAFYGDPRRADFARDLVLVVPPWPMTYEGRPIRGVQVHRKCADSLKAVFDDIADQVGHDWSQLPAGAVKFSGSYNYRPIRGSSRLSCHAFGAAIDLDADENEMNTRGNHGTMSPLVVAAFKRQGWFWGGDFRGRLDPMHFQAANERSLVAELESEFSPIGSAQAAELPPMTDGHGSEAESYAARGASIEELPPSASATTFLHVDNTNELMGELGHVGALWKSKIAWLTGGLGTTAASAAANSDPVTTSLLAQLMHRPAFWLLVACVAIAGAVIYFRWRDHGRGQRA